MGVETHYSQQDFGPGGTHIPVKNLAVEPVAGQVTPSASNVGKIYENTATGNLEIVRNATTVIVLAARGEIDNAAIAAGAAIALSKLAVDPLARANHTGTQTASTISNFDVQVRTSRLDQMAAPTAAVSMNSQRLTNVADPTSAADAATMQWVQSVLAANINGHDYKDAVRVAVSSNVNLSAPGASLDGVAMSAGDRFAPIAQTDGTQNGIYVWNGSGTPASRATDADASAEITNGMAFDVTAGTLARNRLILTTADPITLGTTALTFQAFPVGQTYVAGTGISISGNTISLATPVAIANGGTGATTAAGARSSLGTNRAGGKFAVPTLTAGTDTDVTHNLNTTDLIMQVRQVSNAKVVQIDVRAKDANTATVNADVAVTSGTLELLALPLGS